MTDSSLIFNWLTLSEELAETTSGAPTATERACIALGLALAKHYQERPLLCSPRGAEKTSSLFRQLKESFPGPLFSCLPEDAAQEARWALCLANAPLLSPSEILTLYEEVFAFQTQGKDGVVFTPAKLAQHMTRKSHEYYEQETPPHILDPACGAGTFLLPAWKALCEARGEKLLLQEDTPVLCGVDKSPFAVDVACHLLRLVMAEGLQKENRMLSNRELPFACLPGDSLLPVNDINNTTPRGVSWHNAFPNVMRKGGFDIVIGNPPYGLSRNEQLSATENAILKREFAAFRSGKVNKYMAFLARGFQLLRPQGILAFVVPNSWLGIPSGTSLRHYFLERGALLEIEVLPKGVFPSAGVETVVTYLQKESFHPQFTIAFRNKDLSKHDEQTQTLPVDLCQTLPEMMIPLRWKKDTPLLFRHLENYCSPLGEDCFPVRPMIALQAYAKGKGQPPQSEREVKDHVFHFLKKEFENDIPYLEGSDIQRYRISWSGKYLRYGPWLAEPQTLSRFSGPRIVIREITQKGPYALLAALLDEPFLYNKSVLHILPESKGAETYFPLLLAILNSKLGSFHIRYRGRKSQRELFPKILVSDLKDFLLPNQLLETAPELIALLQSQIVILQELFESLPSPDSLRPGTLWLNNDQKDAFSAKVLTVQKHLDDAVFDLYKVSKKQRRSIDEHLAV